MCDLTQEDDNVICSTSNVYYPIVAVATGFIVGALTGAATEVVLQGIEHGFEFECYDWGAVASSAAFDALLGATMVGVVASAAKNSSKGYRAYKGVRELRRTRGCFEGDTPVWTQTGTIAISELDVGDRVSTWQGGSKSDVDGSWWIVELVVGDPDLHDSTRLELLRPLEWLNSNRLSEGDAVYIDDAELSVDGWAVVTGLRQGPPPRLGHGRVVVAKSRRSSKGVYVVKLKGDYDPIRVTGSHPLFSLDRGRWASVSELVIGEKLATKNGPTPIEALVYDGRTSTVYNLHVESDQEYLVGLSGVRAHNKCPKIRGTQMRLRNPAQVETIKRDMLAGQVSLHGARRQDRWHS